MGRMSDLEMQTFLDEPRIGHLVTLQADGSPQAAPIWYEYRDGVFLIWTDRFTRRFKNISADPRVVLSVATEDEPYRYVTAECTVTTSEVEVKETAFRLAERYQGGEQGKTFVEDYHNDGVSILLVLKPTKLVAWTYMD